MSHELRPRAPVSPFRSERDPLRRERGDLRAASLAGRQTFYVTQLRLIHAGRRLAYEMAGQTDLIADLHEQVTSLRRRGEQ